MKTFRASEGEAIGDILEMRLDAFARALRDEFPGVTVVAGAMDEGEDDYAVLVQGDTDLAETLAGYCSGLAEVA